MKKTVFVVILITALFVANSSLALGCELCAALRNMCLTDAEITGIIKNCATRAEAEALMRSMIDSGVSFCPQKNPQVNAEMPKLQPARQVEKTAQNQDPQNPFAELGIRSTGVFGYPEDR